MCPVINVVYEYQFCLYPLAFLQNSRRAEASPTIRLIILIFRLTFDLTLFLLISKKLGPGKLLRAAMFPFKGMELGRRRANMLSEFFLSWTDDL